MSYIWSTPGESYLPNVDLIDTNRSTICVIEMKSKKFNKASNYNQFLPLSSR